jgi:hypothetical protein
MAEHDHKFFIFQVKADFEPTKLKTTDGRVLYIRIEYAFSGCNCGAALKTRIKTSDFNA